MNQTNSHSCNPPTNFATRRLTMRNAGAVLALSFLALLNACSGGGGSSSTPPVTPPAPPVGVNGPAWYGYARDAQHSDLGLTLALGGVAGQNLGQIVWETSVDLAPATNTASHYGSPMITSKNTVLIPVKTTLAGGFQMKALQGANGQPVWNISSDYILPSHNWIPSFGATLTKANRLYMPGAGGKVLYVDNPDTAGATAQTLVFYGASNYANATSTFDSNVFINTPITSDSNGNIFFGFLVSGTNPQNLVSGIARIAADGTGSWVAANTAIGQTGVVNPAMNSAPGLSNDDNTVYVGVHTATTSANAQGIGYLLALDSTTLATKTMVELLDPYTGQPAWMTDDSTASPVIGPDNDVYYGVLESNFPSHNDRGWLLHFDATLAVLKTPGSFGWDDTPSIVPASMVASYKGSSTYLLMTKYNNYADFPGGDGKNKMAILDPNAIEVDPVEATNVMNEVMTVLGPTSDTANFPSDPGAVKEWCVNSAAVDPNTKSVFINSEDGFLYRWDLTTGLLSQKIWLDSGYGQAYTPTAIGPDGTIYSINAANLIAVNGK
jgi:hypothetical protein